MQIKKLILPWKWKIRKSEINATNVLRYAVWGPVCFWSCKRLNCSSTFTQYPYPAVINSKPQHTTCQSAITGDSTETDIALRHNRRGEDSCWLYNLWQSDMWWNLSDFEDSSYDQYTVMTSIVCTITLPTLNKGQSCGVSGFKWRGVCYVVRVLRMQFVVITGWYNLVPFF